MTSTVSFRGPILFVHDSTVLLEVLIPNSESGGIFADTTLAKAHIPEIWQLSTNKRIRLIGRNVSIEPIGGGAAPSLDKSFDDKAEMEDMVNLGAAPDNRVTLRPWSSTPDDDDLLASIIRIKGGIVRTSVKTDLPFDIPGRFPQGATTKHLAVLTTWESPDIPVRITITNRRTGAVVDTWTLRAGEEVFIYNWDYDTPNPSKDDLIAPYVPKSSSDFLPDQDFKWLYHLLQPAAGKTWEEWLTLQLSSEFPAPHTTDPASQKILGERGALLRRDPPISACDGSKFRKT